MSAQLYPGIKSLNLVIDQPYDLIRTTDIRDDLQSIKVWYSSTSGFDPKSTNPANRGTLFSNGIDRNVTISGLAANTRYYVRYAFISKIEPDVFTVSQQLTQLVYDENTTVYGYLTNDPTGISTAADGTGGNFALATGIFKVFKLSEDKTGAGPVYSTKSNSTFYLTGATINATTGVYSCTGMTQNSGSVTFLADYDGIQVEAVWNVYRGLAGEKAPLVFLSATNSDFIYKDQYATTAETPSTEITATLTNLPGATVTFTAQAYKRIDTVGVATPLGSVSFTQTGNKIVITQAQFGALGVTVGTVVVTATVGSVSDSFTLYRINDGTEQITVELSNSAHVIPAANNGDTLLANYSGSGTYVKVKEGIKYLNVDPDSPYNTKGSWWIDNINAVNITCDTTPTIGSNFILFDTHAAMTADQAYIDYTIKYITTSNVAGESTVRQSFAKSKEGVIGATAQSVNITVLPSQAFLTPKNSTIAAPSTVVLTATASNFTNPTYTWLVDGIAPITGVGTVNGNTLTLNSFAPLASKLIKCTASEGSFSAFDTFTQYSLKEGDDAIATGLSNENQTISCDSTGTPISGQLPLASQLYVAKGTTLINGNSTPAVIFGKSGYTGGSASDYAIDSSTGVISIYALNTQFATATFNATVNGVVYYKVLTLNKSIDGASAPIVTLTSTTQVFIIAKNTGAIAPASIDFTTNIFNLGTSPTYTWSVSTDSGATFTIIPGYTSSTASLPSFTTGTKIIKVSVTGNGRTVTDQTTVYILREGSDSLQAGLVNENQTITCDTSGNPITTVSLNSQLVVARGSQVLAYPDVSFSKISDTNMTSTINTQSGVITVTNVTGGTSIIEASAIYRATIGTTTLDKKLTINKSINGADGARTVPLTLYQTASSTPTVLPSGSSTVNFSNSDFSAPTTLNGWSKDPTIGQPGDVQYKATVNVVDATKAATVTVTPWSSAVIAPVAKNGTNGTPGSTGGRGIANITRSSTTDVSTLKSQGYSTSSTVGYECQQALNSSYTSTADRVPQTGDSVTLFSGTTYSNPYLFNGSTWGYVALVVDGSLIVTGSIQTSSLSLANTTSSNRIQLTDSSLTVYSGGYKRVVIGLF
jgi:hypothetical protein